MPALKQEFLAQSSPQCGSECFPTALTCSARGTRGYRGGNDAAARSSGAVGCPQASTACTTPHSSDRTSPQELARAELHTASVAGQEATISATSSQGQLVRDRLRKTPVVHICKRVTCGVHSPLNLRVWS